MLYDPKWEKKTEAKADPEFQGVTLSGFIAWLETKNPNEEYAFCWAERCAVGQYKKYLGHDNPVVSFDVLGSAGGRGRNWLEEIVIQHPRTFGGALERARAVIAND